MAWRLKFCFTWSLLWELRNRRKLWFFFSPVLQKFWLSCFYLCIPLFWVNILFLFVGGAGHSGNKYFHWTFPELQSCETFVSWPIAVSSEQLQWCGERSLGRILCLFSFISFPLRPSVACIINICLSFHYDPVLNVLEAACEMDILFRDFLVTGVHPASFCFSLTVNALFTDGLKNDTFGSLQLSPPFNLTFIPIDIIKIWIISQTTSFNFNELKAKIPKAILCDFSLFICTLS